MADTEREGQPSADHIFFAPELGGANSVLVFRRGRFMGTLRQDVAKKNVVFAWELREQDLETPIDELGKIVEKGKELKTQIEASRPPAVKRSTPK